jgi:hypothetical protein
MERPPSGAAFFVLVSTGLLESQKTTASLKPLPLL